MRSWCNFVLCFRNHDWFKKELPAYLFPPVSEQEASIVDMEAVKDLCDVSDFLYGEIRRPSVALAWSEVLDLEEASEFIDL